MDVRWRYQNDLITVRMYVGREKSIALEKKKKPKNVKHLLVTFFGTLMQSVPEDFPSLQ